MELFPVLGRPGTHGWGGPLGVPRDWFASVGLDRATGIGWAGGYVGDGLATTNLAGRTLPDLVSAATRDDQAPLGRPSLAALGAGAAALARGERRPAGDDLGRPEGGEDRAPVASVQVLGRFLGS